MPSSGGIETECFMCEQMRRRRPQQHRALQTTGKIQTCLLCNRRYCDAHKSESESGICEVNHETYYVGHSRRPGVFPNLASRTETLSHGEEVRMFLPSSCRESVLTFSVDK